MMSGRPDVVVIRPHSSGAAGVSRRRLWTAGFVAVLGLACIAFFAHDATTSVDPGTALAIRSQSLAHSQGNAFKVIAGWKSQHHSYAHYVKEIFVDAGAPREIIRRNHYSIVFTPLPLAFNDEALRVELWDHPDTPAAVFSGNPGLGAMGRRDLLAWVSSGRNIVFTGGYSSLAAMNEYFGFSLEEVPYSPGPFWRNPRNTPGTPFAYGPDRLDEYGGSPVYGVKIDSIPLSGYSMYDSFRVSTVFYIKYNLGTVCYVAATFSDMAPSNPWGKALRDAIRM